MEGGRELLELDVKLANYILYEDRDRLHLKVDIAHFNNTANISDDVVYEWLNETDILIQDMENFNIQARTPPEEYDIFLERHFELAMNRLYKKRDDLLLKIDTHFSKTEKISDVVYEWLKETYILIQEAENLIARARTRHVRQEEFRILKEKVNAHNMELEFLGPISTPIPIPSLEDFSCGNIVCFNSRENASDQLFVALQDYNCHVIGLYGRQGSGKTALVKAMGKKVKYLEIFKQVLFAKVTQNPNIKSMQDEIADSLNIKLDEKSVAGRAARIFSTIVSMNGPILVIFDDFRAKFNPEEVGIPCDSYNCRFLLTACCQQECDWIYDLREIQLDPLSREETWILFMEHSGILDHGEYSSSFDLLSVAREVAFECKGIPRTIKDVGYSLRSKPIEEWQITLDSLKHPMAEWQIFLSFRGEDTRDSFTGFLYQALSQGGFKTFIDDGGLHTGNQISPSLLNSIEASRLSIVVLSENYANSTWCLDELVKIMECMKLKKQIVWPIFYKVEPSDIRHLKKSYGRDMAQHENNFGMKSESVQKWRTALFEVSNLSGKHYTDGYEYEFIQKIVEHAKCIRTRLQIRNI